MKKIVGKYDVTIFYFNSPHLNQLYDGFAKLSRLGVCRVRWVKNVKIDSVKPILKTVINGKIVYFDCLDGYNWINGSYEDNIRYVKNTYLDAKVYFKRSFSDNNQKDLYTSIKMYPLGLNFNVYPEFYPFGLYRAIYLYKRIKQLLFKNEGSTLKVEELSYNPTIVEDGKVLFLARLWDPSHASSHEEQLERKVINQNRIETVFELKKEFGGIFQGGIEISEYSKVSCPKELLVPKSITNRNAYIEEMHQSNICIATDGLHKSIGWKFGEYVASSKAIVTEKLNYNLPGDFVCGKNYLEYSDCSDLKRKIYYLLDNKTVMRDMMNSNYEYYNRHVEPSSLVLRALEIVDNAY